MTPYGALGCTLAQGYHFARPLPPAGLDALLAAGRPLGVPAAPGGHPAPGTGELRRRRVARTRRGPLPTNGPPAR